MSNVPSGVMIHHGTYTIHSYGNGWAYEIKCNDTQASVWLQDDDARIFGEEIDAALGLAFNDLAVESICSDYFTD